MGRNFDDYPGFQQISGMPILLQQSVGTRLWHIAFLFATTLIIQKFILEALTKVNVENLSNVLKNSKIIKLFLRALLPSTKVAILEMAFLQQKKMTCWSELCGGERTDGIGFFKGGLATKDHLGHKYSDNMRDTWYVNHEGIRLTGANAYGYYDWFAPEEGEEGYILAKHEGE